MRANFPKALPRLLVFEGKFSNHPSDPGGVTLEGIIQRVYDGYRLRKGLPTRALKRAMLGTAEWQAERDDIYRLQYWNAVKGDDLPAGLDFVMFDGAVNSGAGQAVKWLQRALQAAGLYHGEIDGDFGQGTTGAVLQHPDHDALIAGVLSRRLGMLQNLRTWPVFGKGWSRRVASVRAIGQAWASGSIGPQPLQVADIGGNAKGYAGDVAMAAYDPQDGTNAAAGGTGLGVMLQGVQYSLVPQLERVSYNGGDLALYATYVILGLTALSAIVAVAGAVASFVASLQNKHAARAIDGDVSAELPEIDAAEVPLVPPSGGTSGVMPPHTYEITIKKPRRARKTSSRKRKRRTAPA